MLDENIINLFEQFSKSNSLDYNKKALPYRPYGVITGTTKNNSFQIFVYTPESRGGRFFDTIFAIPIFDLLPEGFCVGHIGDAYIKGKSFDELIKIRSSNLSTVTTYLDDRFKGF